MLHRPKTSSKRQVTSALALCSEEGRLHELSIAAASPGLGEKQLQLCARAGGAGRTEAAGVADGHQLGQFGFVLQQPCQGDSSF